MRRQQRPWRLTTLLLLAAGCGGGESGGPTPPPAPTVVSVSVTPASAVLLEGDSVDLGASVTLSDGSTATRNASWATSATTVATVSAAGRVSAVGAGGATITATIDGKSASASITVTRRVATVTLSVTARSMLLGDTLTLVATPRYSDATVATGKIVAWASTNRTVATVSSAGLVTAVGAGAATISATVEGRVASAAITVRPPAQTTLDVSARTAAFIDAAGGTLTATSNGVTYRLVIPAGALAVRTQITMTPVTAVANLALSGGAVGAVDLQPSGLTFARPARLRIGAAAPPRAGFTLTGFSIVDASGRTSREFAGAAPNEVVVLVTHFSTQGAGFGTTTDVQSLPTLIPRAPAAQAAVDAFLAAAVATPPNAATLLSALTQWFDGSVLPLLQGAGSDQALLVALGDYELWSADAFIAFPNLPIHLNDPALASRRAQWRSALSPKLQQSIQGNNQLCAAQRSVTAMQNVLFWQSRAEFYGVATAGLDRGSVLQGLCAQLVVQLVAYPDPVQSGFPNDLDASFALRVLRRRRSRPHAGVDHIQRHDRRHTRQAVTAEQRRAGSVHRRRHRDGQHDVQREPHRLPRPRRCDRRLCTARRERNVARPDRGATPGLSPARSVGRVAAFRRSASRSTSRLPKRRMASRGRGTP